MKTIQERRLEFLEDTVKYYSEDVSRRAIDRSPGKKPPCQYKTRDGRKCAIGRHILDEKYSSDLEGKFAHQVLHTVKKEIAELGSNFLSYIQNLHDHEDNWDLENNKLSITGIKLIESIKIEYCQCIH